MRFSLAELANCRALAQMALEEDLGPRGDLTSQALIPAATQGKAAFVARKSGVLAGLPAVLETFEQLDSTLTVEVLVEDGSPIAPGQQLAVVRGSMRAILTGERTALNFLQRLSGVATQTSHYVALLAGLPVQLLDTRKTTPGWRLLEKYAVRMGGGHNHRLGLYDGVLIKDNHIAAIGLEPAAAGEAVRRARVNYRDNVPVEVEVDTLEQLEIALQAAPTIILLDNMAPPLLRQAVARRNLLAPGVKLEASGGITLETIRAIAETGVDRISVGALTHSATALDIGLDYLT